KAHRYSHCWWVGGLIVKNTESQTLQKILSFIETNPGATVTEIADRIGKARSTVKPIVQRLASGGAISARRALNRGAIHYYPAGADIQCHFGVNRLVNLFDRCVMSVRRGCAG
ncbi:winged helix-turn-helix domain-containing protein, partial [Dickeya dianthicola]